YIKIMVKKTLSEWLEEAISKGHINYLEYNNFTKPTKIVALKCLKLEANIELDEKIVKDFVNE
ncbi:10840_t:CDS:2, partial [Ambispora leptoticha]